jgi:hypothetical protein
MLKEPERTNLIVDQAENFGGTWYSKVVQTTVPTSFMLQASNNPPFPDGAGVQRFLAPLATEFDPSNVHHNRMVKPFLPGNSFFYLARVVDDDGNWQIVSGQFRTKRRTVTIEFEVLHIINDGASGQTYAEFRIWVMEGGTSVRDYFFGNVDEFRIWDEGADNKGKTDYEYIKLGAQATRPEAAVCTPFILGPKDITEDTQEIGILTRGLCYRSAGSNDHTSNFVIGDNFPNPKASVPFAAIFSFRTGLVENMHHEPLVVRARPQEVDVEFEYDLTMFLTVNYT